MLQAIVRPFWNKLVGLIRNAYPRRSPTPDLSTQVGAGFLVLPVLISADDARGFNGAWARGPAHDQFGANCRARLIDLMIKATPLLRGFSEMKKNAELISLAYRRRRVTILHNWRDETADFVKSKVMDSGRQSSPNRSRRSRKSWTSRRLTVGRNGLTYSCPEAEM